NAIALAPLIVAFGHFERPRATTGPPAPAWRYVVGALMTCAGLSLLAAQGVGGYGRLGLNVWGVALTLAGIALVARRSGRLAACHAPLPGPSCRCACTRAPHAPRVCRRCQWGGVRCPRVPSRGRPA